MKCNTSHIVYLITCKTFGIQYIGSATTTFILRFNNCKSSCRKYSSTSNAFQANLHSYLAQDDHKGMEDWEVTLIDHAHDSPSVRRREMFWQYKLNSFYPNGLNEQGVVLDYG